MLPPSVLRKINSRRRRRPKGWRPPPLTVDQILAWADKYHARTGKWPNTTSGRVPGPDGPNWNLLDAALRDGLRGLPGGSSLAKLFAEHRGHRNILDLPPLTTKQILAWADQWRRDFGAWPTADSGAIPDAPVDTWRSVNRALYEGLRSFPGGSSLAQLLAERRGYRNHMALAPLEVAQILAWADRHHDRTGRWPTRTSGIIPGTDRETWGYVDTALRTGLRGLPEGSSLARLLAERRSYRNQVDLPSFTIKKILGWADRWFREFGRWPKRTSGPIPYAQGETWMAVNMALSKGLRGLPPGESLAALLAKHRGVRNHLDRPPLTKRLICEWADRHYERNGRWPAVLSGPIPESDGDSWRAIDQCLRKGQRGLPGDSSLAKLLKSRRTPPPPSAK